MYQLSCPSKTFLIGEYAVLDGGHGVVVSTGPRFRVDFKEVAKEEESYVKGLSPQGPPMDFLKDNLDIFSHFAMDMHDPHEHKGGFGWSSAQFLFLYMIKEWVRQAKPDILPKIDRAALLEEFLAYSWDGDGWAPSGLDVLSQLEGKILFLQSPRKIIDGKVAPIEFSEYHQIKDWPFEDIQFVLLRTGKKVATHSHLSNLQGIRTSSLGKLAEESGKSLLDKDEEEFIRTINQYKNDLREQDLVDPASWNTQQELMQRPEVLAIKGCGALGADVLLVIVVTELLEDFLEFIEEEEFLVVGTSETITEGLSFSKIVEETKDLES